MDSPPEHSAARICEVYGHRQYQMNEDWVGCETCDMKWPVTLRPEACRVCHGSRKMNIGDRKVELDDCDHCTDGYEP